jgi:hypothetical protein
MKKIYHLLKGIFSRRPKTEADLAPSVESLLNGELGEYEKIVYGTRFRMVVASGDVEAIRAFMVEHQPTEREINQMLNSVIHRKQCKISGIQRIWSVRTLGGVERISLDAPYYHLTASLENCDAVIALLKEFGGKEYNWKALVRG